MNLDSDEITNNEISKANMTDIGKNIKLKISLLDEKSKILNIPKGTKITIDGQKYDIINNNIVLYTLIEAIEENSYNKTINFKLDMSSTDCSNFESNVQYNLKLKIDAYLEDNEILIGNNPLISSQTEFKFQKVEAFGIEVRTIGSQLVNLEDTRIVNINAKIGTLEDGTYVNIKTFKRQDQFKYTEIVKSTSAESQRFDIKKDTFMTIIFKEE